MNVNIAFPTRASLLDASLPSAPSLFTPFLGIVRDKANSSQVPPALVDSQHNIITNFVATLSLLLKRRWKGSNEEGMEE